MIIKNPLKLKLGSKRKINNVQFTLVNRNIIEIIHTSSIYGIGKIESALVLGLKEKNISLIYETCEYRYIENYRELPSKKFELSHQEIYHK